jgi:hypothetical protein
MDINEKSNLLLNMVALGMDFESACLLAELTQEEQDALAADEQFMRNVSFSAKCLERDLLYRLQDAMKGNASVGNTTEVRWMLERLNKERFGKGAGTDSSNEGLESHVHIYLPDNGRDA